MNNSIKDKEKDKEDDRNLIPERLFISNLSPTVTEYILLKLFTPHGKIKTFNFLWHKHGPKKGEPRGYAFIEYDTESEALKAIKSLDGRLVAGRHLRVQVAVENEEEFLERLAKEERNNELEARREANRIKAAQAAAVANAVANAASGSGGSGGSGSTGLKMLASMTGKAGDTGSKIKELESKLSQLEGGSSTTSSGSGSSKPNSSLKSSSSTTAKRYEPYKRKIQNT